MIRVFINTRYLALAFSTLLMLVLSTQSTAHEDIKTGLKGKELALAGSSLNPVRKKMLRMGLKRTYNVRYSRASWYGGYFHGRTTANMEIFDKNLLTAAHKNLPLGTYLLVTNLENKREVIVRVNDRGPYVRGRDIDLSENAAKLLGSHKKGIALIRYELLSEA